MKPGKLDLPVIWRGCRWNTLTLRWKDQNGDPFDLTGWAVRAQSQNIDLNARITSPASGETQLGGHTDISTANFRLGAENWDWIFTDATGQKLQPLLSGRVEIKQPITSGTGLPAPPNGNGGPPPQPPPQVITTATPQFVPPAGQYNATGFPLTIVITCATPNATIHYTRDGTVPTSTHGTSIPSGGSTLPVSAGAPLKAIASSPGNRDSVLASATYTPLPQCATPTFDPNGGGFNANFVNITFNCATPGASIRYTRDNTTPTGGPNGHGFLIAPGTVVFQNIDTNGVTIRAIAYRTGFNSDSDQGAAFFRKTP